MVDVPKNRLMFVFMLLWIAICNQVDGHGTPIRVEESGGKLVVGGGLPDTSGFAPMIFVEDDEDGEPLGNFNVPPFGPVIVWQIPGFEIFSLENQSSLSLEVLLRPVAVSTTGETRTLWYWNDATELVEPAPAASALYLLGLDDRSQTLLPNDTAAPPPMLLADPLTGQQGFHNHGLLAYALDNSPSPHSGAYGLFARLTSNLYEPSDPFLVVLNRSVEYDQMVTAALTINAAAVDPAPTAGDYDGNGHVEAADYGLWRARFGDAVAPFTSADGNGNGFIDAADYVVWREHFAGGTAVGRTPITANVPEPSGIAAFAAWISAVVGAGKRWRGRATGGHSSASSRALVSRSPRLISSRAAAASLR